MSGHAELQPILRSSYIESRKSNIDSVNLTVKVFDDRAVVTCLLKTSRNIDSDAPLILYGGKGMALDRIIVDGNVLDYL